MTRRKPRAVRVAGQGRSHPQIDMYNTAGGLATSRLQPKDGQREPGESSRCTTWRWSAAQPHLPLRDGIVTGEVFTTITPAVSHRAGPERHRCSSLVPRVVRGSRAGRLAMLIAMEPITAGRLRRHAGGAGGSELAIVSRLRRLHWDVQQ